MRWTSESERRDEDIGDGDSQAILYDGNTDGTGATGRAFIDGGDPMTGWTQCQSANECDPIGGIGSAKVAVFGPGVK